MSIRTTVTLDDDVFERTTDLSKARGIPFRRALNDLIRAGLVAESAARPTSHGPFSECFARLIGHSDWKTIVPADGIGYPALLFLGSGSRVGLVLWASW
jgi:hypothetical protein